MTEASAEKKARAPRKPYGFAEDAVIRIVAEKAKNYRGDRREWFQSLRAAEGQTVAEWAKSAQSLSKGPKDPPRGWLRHFASQDGSVVLDKAG